MTLPPPPPPSSIPPPPAWGSGPSATPAEPVLGLAKAVRALFWVVVATVALVLLAAINRKSVWDGWLDGSKTLSDVDDADGLIGVTVLLGALAQLAVAIVLCVWSLRAANNANRRFGATTKPGLAGGSWFIPLAWYVVPFVQLRKVARAVGLDVGLLGLWQASFIVWSVVNVIGRIAGNLDVDRASEMSGRLDAQVVWFSVSLVVAVVSAYVGGRTVTEISRAQQAA